MKRALLQNVSVSPYESGSVIDRRGFLSAALGVNVITAGELELTISHGDTSDGDFETLSDTHVAPLAPPTLGAGPVRVPGIYTFDANVGVINVDIDLVGCKQFVTMALSGDAATDATLAYVLGDAQYMPAT